MENGEWRCVTTCLTRAVIIFMDSEIRFEIKYFPLIRLIRQTKVLQIQCSADSVSLVDGEGGAAEQDGEDVHVAGHRRRHQRSLAVQTRRAVHVHALPQQLDHLASSS